MNRGTVKWFNDVKGYGFIVKENEPDKDIFVHYTAIVTDGFKTLCEGQTVEFDILCDDNGNNAQARNVKKVQE